MRLVQILVMSLMVLGSVVVSAQPAAKAKAEAPAKKGQSRAEFYDNMLKMYKAHKQELKDLQIQFINKQFNQDIENQKAMTELQKQFNPKGTADSNKNIAEQLNKKNTEYQAKQKADNEQFYTNVIGEKSKAFFEKASKMTKDFDSIK